jgi:Protein of unknown function (DUF2934)
LRQLTKRRKNTNRRRDSVDPRETYQKKIKTQLSKWKTKIDQLKTQVEKAGTDARLKYEEYVPMLHAKREEAESKLEELKTASEETWENVKAGVEYAWGELTRAAESAISKLRSEGSTSRDEEIRLIAYKLWEEEGRLHGRHLDHWLKAEAIWQEQQGHHELDQKRRIKRKEAETETVRRIAKKKPRSKGEDNLRTL